MKRPLGFADKLRIFKKWMRQHKDFGLVCTCSACTSTRVRRIDSSERRTPGMVEYKATYECMDCGSMAEARETWDIWPKGTDTTAILSVSEAEGGV